MRPSPVRSSGRRCTSLTHQQAFEAAGYVAPLLSAALPPSLVQGRSISCGYFPSISPKYQPSQPRYSASIRNLGNLSHPPRALLASHHRSDAVMKVFNCENLMIYDLLQLPAMADLVRDGGFAGLLPRFSYRLGTKRKLRNTYLVDFFI